MLWNVSLVKLHPVFIDRRGSEYFGHRLLGMFRSVDVALNELSAFHLWREGGRK